MDSDRLELVKGWLDQLCETQVGGEPTEVVDYAEPLVTVLLDIAVSLRVLSGRA